MKVLIEIPPRAYDLVRTAAADSFGAENDKDVLPSDVARWMWLNFSVDVLGSGGRPERKLIKRGISARYQRRNGDDWRPVRGVPYANDPPQTETKGTE
jgi:hypothetical protein